MQNMIIEKFTRNINNQKKPIKTISSDFNIIVRDHLHIPNLSSNYASSSLKRSAKYIIEIIK